MDSGSSSSSSPQAAGSGSDIVQFTLVGDTMLGRLVDQMFPTHITDAPEDQAHAIYFKAARPQIAENWKKRGYAFVWGDTINFFHNSDINIVNLETSVTTHSTKEPKHFNYRMHPDNVRALTEAKIHYCSLANNHILDFREPGMFETMQRLTEAGIAWAGVGRNQEEAARPAFLHSKNTTIACISFSDHYEYWRAKESKPGLNYLDVEHFTPADVERISGQILSLKNPKAKEKGHSEEVNVVVVSLHWGSNYAWIPPRNFRRFAHQLIDRCLGDDLEARKKRPSIIIHGHSAHHVQPLEVYKGMPIIYGCGDFVDDYAVDDEYRNDLGFVYRIRWDPTKKRWSHFYLHPTKIKNFSVSTQMPTPEREWLLDTVQDLSKSFGTKFRLQKDAVGLGEWPAATTTETEAAPSGPFLEVLFEEQEGDKEKPRQQLV
jgi:poly-gamma-glutamate capsule biosynthesis protein CapA/YwtB (metallophosphatase superfamily)